MQSVQHGQRRASSPSLSSSRASRARSSPSSSPPGALVAKGREAPRDGLEAPRPRAAVTSVPCPSRGRAPSPTASSSASAISGASSFVTAPEREEGPGERNTAARDDPGALAPIRILPRKMVVGPDGVHVDEGGVALVRRLKATESLASVTDCRRERKAPVPASTLEEMLASLEEQGVGLKAREGGGAGRANATLTYYGAAAAFENHQENTKIRMRIRYYVDYARDGSGAITDVRRAAKTSTSGYLELKVKTPRAGEENFVDKYRVVAPDWLVARLVHLDPDAEGFAAELGGLRDELRGVLDDGGAPKNDARRVEAMFSVIELLAKKDRRFLRPGLAISYERAGYTHDEKGYSLDTKRKARSALSVARARFARCFRGEVAPRAEDRRDVQYQLTVDKEVRAHYPLLPAPGERAMPVAEHFDPARGTEVARYPRVVRVVELKEPKIVASRPRDLRSATHNALNDTVVEGMKRSIQWGDFDAQTGKYGSFRGRIHQAHDPRTIKNEKIAVVFDPPRPAPAPTPARDDEG